MTDTEEWNNPRRQSWKHPSAHGQGELEQLMPCVPTQHHSTPRQTLLGQTGAWWSLLQEKKLRLPAEHQAHPRCRTAVPQEEQTTLFRLFYTVFLASKAQAFCLRAPLHYLSTSPLGTVQFWLWEPSFPCFLRQFTTYPTTSSQARYFFLTKALNFSHQLR